MYDPINPAHYQGILCDCSGDSRFGVCRFCGVAIEEGDYVMRIIEDFKLDFCRGTVLKYLLRAGNKEGTLPVEDLRKARWYLDRAIAGLSKSTTAPVQE